MKDEVRDLRDRTKVFALRAIKMFSSLPKTEEARVLGKQVLRQAPLWAQTTGSHSVPV